MVSKYNLGYGSILDTEVSENRKHSAIIDVEMLLENLNWRWKNDKKSISFEFGYIGIIDYFFICS